VETFLDNVYKRRTQKESMKMGSTFDRLQKIIAHLLTVDASRILPDTHITNELDPDSLEVAEIFIEIEGEFHITLPEAEGDLGTVADIVAVIDEAIAVQRSDRQQAS
jgi:acyl carrier protein